ncbi:MAG: DUF4249 domain-containing protein [Lentimicrobium sp.]|nr:DUF4249 domain-containing protein [Lentimicrobium sp.]
MKKCIYYFFSLFLFLSCDKEISIEVPETEPALVIHSTLVPYSFPHGKYLGFEISGSRNIFDTTSFSSIDNAIVLLYKNGNPEADTLKCEKYHNKDFYPIRYSPTQGPLTGEHFRIEVSVPGYESVSAETSIPQKVNIEEINIDRMAYEDEGGLIYSKVTLTFTDNPVETNYYEVVLSFTGAEYSPEDYRQLASFAPYVVSEIHYPSPLNPDLKKPQYLLFTDKTINGQSVQFEFFFQARQILDKGIKVLLSEIISIQLRNVSQDYYKYRSTWLYSVYNKQGDILYGTGEPVNVFTNIENGLGIFASFNNDISTLQLEELELN